MNNDERDTYIKDTHTVVIALKQSVEDHQNNKVIHQVPPCESHKGLSAKLWAILMLAIGAAVAAVKANL